MKTKILNYKKKIYSGVLDEWSIKQTNKNHKTIKTINEYVIEFINERVCAKKNTTITTHRFFELSKEESRTTYKT